MLIQYILVPARTSNTVSYVQPAAAAADNCAGCRTNCSRAKQPFTQRCLEVVLHHLQVCVRCSKRILILAAMSAAQQGKAKNPLSGAYHGLAARVAHLVLVVPA
jgi:hypothetical protein